MKRCVICGEEAKGVIIKSKYCVNCVKKSNYTKELEGQKPLSEWYKTRKEDKKKW